MEREAGEQLHVTQTVEVYQDKKISDRTKPRTSVACVTGFSANSSRLGTETRSDIFDSAAEAKDSHRMILSLSSVAPSSLVTEHRTMFMTYRFMIS